MKQPACIIKGFVLQDETIPIPGTVNYIQNNSDQLNPIKFIYTFITRSIEPKYCLF